MAQKRKNLELLGAQIIYRNFEGKKGPYNPSGERGYTVVIEDEGLVSELRRQGWNVKELTPKEDAPADTPKRWGLPVKVVFENYPPQVNAVKDGTILPLNEDTIGYLDLVTLEYCDMIISPSYWEMNGKSGIAAYLSQLYAVVETTVLDRKYGEYPVIQIRKE